MQSPQSLTILETVKEEKDLLVILDTSMGFCYSNLMRGLIRENILLSG